MNKKFLLLVAVLIGVVGNSFSQTEVSTVEKAQALFVYNFSRHIGWPESSFTSNEFVIGVVGSKEIYNELVKITKDKLVGKYKIVVKLFNSPEEVSTSHMLVLGERIKGNTEAYKAKLDNFPSLIVNSNEAATGDIKFKMVDQKMSFIVSRNTIKNKGLTMSKRLEEMASNII